MKKILGIVVGVVSLTVLFQTILKINRHRKAKSENTPSEPPAPRTGFWAHSEQKKTGEIEEESIREKAASKLSEMHDTLTDSGEDESGLEGTPSRLSR